MEKIILRDKFFACRICGIAFKDFSQATIDHVLPLSKGGSNHTDNLQLACSYCNQFKADKVP